MPPGDVALFGFQVVVERQKPRAAPGVHRRPAGWRHGGDNSIAIPQPGAIYKYEVVAIEARDDESGNQTISESFFCTALITTVDCELPN